MILDNVIHLTISATCLSPLEDHFLCHHSSTTLPRHVTKAICQTSDQSDLSPHIKKRNLRFFPVIIRPWPSKSSYRPRR